MSQENVEIVRRAYEAWNGGDPEAARELLSPEIEWHLPSNFPDRGTWRGRDAVVSGLASFLGSWDELRADVRELIDAGDRLVAFVRFQGRATITGLSLEGAGVDAMVWTLRDGKAVDVRMYGGTRDALEAVGLSGPDAG